VKKSGVGGRVTGEDGGAFGCHKLGKGRLGPRAQTKVQAP
jgi:hypothetical protein